uniref:HAT C-terminal dimerisation domain-containing protein n=1 Tax=Latimeria chalumnae TaxID=7897 RepID=H3B4H0_LATCH
FLAERGLAFRGENEIFGSPFLAQHINKHGNMGRGHASYLSSTICEEFIALWGEKVFEHIVKELKEAKYFSVSVDSTPDISKLGQLTCVVRYVLPNGPVERFLTFLDFETHSGQDIAKSLLQFFEKIGVNIADCWGQSYDNASNLSGKSQGMQAWIRERSKNAVYIPCCVHSLNLVGQCAVDCCFTAISFFSFVQKLWFFAASTKRWKVLLERLAEANEKLPVKNLSEACWSAHADAVTALRKGYDRIKAALDHLCDKRIEAYLVIMDKLSSALVQRLDAYKEVCSRFGFLLKLTSMSVGEIHDAAKKLLQYYSTDFEDCVIEELVHFSEFARKSSGDGPEIQMYRLLVQNGLQDTFPNIHIILRMYLCLMISNCSGEHSFSKMALIKNRLQSTMHQERLSMLTLMSIEHEILCAIDFSAYCSSCRNTVFKR